MEWSPDQQRREEFAETAIEGTKEWLLREADAKKAAGHEKLNRTEKAITAAIKDMSRKKD